MLKIRVTIKDNPEFTVERFKEMFRKIFYEQPKSPKYTGPYPTLGPKTMANQQTLINESSRRIQDCK